MSQYNLILTDGGMGDLICQLVAVDYNIRHNPKIHFQVWVPDYLSKFAMHVLPPKTDVKRFSLAHKKFNPRTKGRTSQWFEHGHTPMRTHPVDYGFHMLADKHIYDMKQKNYLQIRPKDIDLKKFALPEKYVCLVTTAAEPVKALSPTTLNDIAASIINLGLTPVFLGKETAACGLKDRAVKAKVADMDYSLGINLVNKTNMLEAAGIIAGAKAFVGMDGGLVHLAGCTDTPIIAGYTLVDPKHVAPIRQGKQDHKFIGITPYLDTPNRFFQTNNSFYNGDYRVFPGWEAVVADMTANRFIDCLTYTVDPTSFNRRSK